MIRYSCDLCGKELPRHSLRYVVRIDLFAAYDELEITRADLERDYREEIKDLIEEIKDMDPQVLMDDVFMNFKFDLCKRCKKIFADRLSRKILLTINLGEMEDR